MQQTSYKGYKIAWQRTGTGLPLVLLHGFCESSHIWTAFVEALKEDYTVITIDLPGFGKSDLIAPYSIAELAEAVHAVVTAQALEDFVLVGHSMGGYVAAAYAECHAVRGLGFFHSHPFADSEEKRINRQKSMQFIQRHGVAPFVSHLFSNLFAPDFVAEQPHIVENFIDECSEQLSDAVLAASKAMMERSDKRALLSELRCPVLFIIGEKDTSIPLSQSLQQCSLPQRAFINILPKVGHIGMFEDSERTLAILRQFMELCKL